MEQTFHPSETVVRLTHVINLLSPCMDDYLFVYDLKNDYYYISPSALERFQLPAHEFCAVERTHAEFVWPEDRPLLQKDLSRILTGQSNSHNLHYRWIGPSGQAIWINCRGRVIRDETGAPSFMVGCINETGARQRADNVSGLLGESSLRTVIQSMGAVCPDGYILRLGIDDFKEINENLGMEYGDRILRRTAECISACLQPGQQLFRAVADEFIVLDFLGGSTQEAIALYKQIRLAIDQFIEENKYEAVYTISGGVLSCSPLLECSYSNLMKLSEFSLSEAKRSGKNSCYVFEEEAYAAFQRKRKLLRCMRHAVHHDFEGFEVYFQPIVLAGSKRLRSAEALLRFFTPQLGAVSPTEFIPVLEETGLIIPVGKWVLQQSLAACREWRGIIPDFSVHVNLSYVQIIKSHILNEILTGIESYLLSPSAIVIELTESGYLESSPHFRKLWQKLKEYGVSLALDDFGTGYSNLHCLYDLSPNIIKIDRSFTMKALRHSYEHTLLSSTIEMVHSIGLQVCIEGIETQEEYDQINQMRPDYIQGYFFGRPCPHSDFENSFIERHGRM